MEAVADTAVMLQDHVNGAKKAGSWAVRETFVVVVTSNLPMITPLIARCFRPIIGTLRSSLHGPMRRSRRSTAVERWKEQWKEATLGNGVVAEVGGGFEEVSGADESGGTVESLLEGC